MTSKREYSRDSFSRFGDDLCELILSHAPISACFRFECVCRQWASTLFATRRSLILSDHFYRESLDACRALTRNAHDYDRYYRVAVNESAFDCALRKCWRIEEIVVDHDVRLNDRLVGLIADRCPSLRSLTCRTPLSSVSAECVERFAAQCGQRLRAVHFEFVAIDTIKTVLRSAPNVRSLTLDNNHSFEINSHFDLWYVESDFDIVGETYLPALESLNANVCLDDQFVPFVDRYAPQLRKLKICLDIVNELDSSLETLRRIELCSRLESLTICVNFASEAFIGEALRFIGGHCRRLRELQLFDVNHADVARYFADGYDRLEKLRLARNRCPFGSVAGLRGCVSLRHLCLREHALDETDLRDIHLSLPALRSLYVSSPNAICDCLLRSVTKMATLVTLKIGQSCGQKLTITSDGVVELIGGCRSLRRLSIVGKTDVLESEVKAFADNLCRKIDLSINSVESMSMISV